MTVEFKVMYLGNKLVSLTTDSPHLPAWEGDIPLVSLERASFKIYQMPDEHAENHYNLLLIQA